MTADALLGLGGNLGNMRLTLDRAVAALCDGKSTRLLARSSDYVTPPWGRADQPDFFNLCIAVSTSLTPLTLLKHAQAIEHKLGRQRSQERWGPRPIDIDLLTYDDLDIRTPELVLPHPRLFERAFVLVPLAEIAPERVIAGRRVREALALVDSSRIRKLPPRDPGHPRR
jgi:2-amino-4-hydroxy-6-hydroxymethyldihydropteridine diphosphokinase